MSRRKRLNPLVNGIRVSYNDAIGAYISGEYVDWQDSGPPSNAQILDFIEERQKQNRYEQARAKIREKGNLNDREMNAVIGLAKIRREGAFSKDYITGVLMGLEYGFGGWKAQVIDTMSHEFDRLLG